MLTIASQAPNRLVHIMYCLSLHWQLRHSHAVDSFMSRAYNNRINYWLHCLPCMLVSVDFGGTAYLFIIYNDIHIP